MQKISKENHTSGGAYRFGEFDLYPSERQLQRRQRVVQLPPKVFDALLLFVRDAERLVRRDELIDALWPDTYVTEANLTNVIVSLRKVLGRDAIQTVSKFGYRFCMSVTGEPGIDETTYATFFRAKELTAVRSIESMARARDLFSLCVANDPMFAAAWAWLGRCCRWLEKFKAEPSVNLDLAQAALRRALAIDPHLACAHRFYTQLQVDLGQSREAMVRLAQRIAERGDEPESFAGLVHALRFCGLLDESVAAHERAKTLDPTIATSVCHTHFLRCEYQATLESYAAAIGTGYYLDAAAWASLGDTQHATTLLQERLAMSQLATLMSGLMSSLLAMLEGRRDQAMAIMRELEVAREPEILFYLARHFAMLGAASDSIRALERARSEGFTSSQALAHDEAFAGLRGRDDFQRELDQARAVERDARRAFEQAGGRRLFTVSDHSSNSGLQSVRVK
jgi:DNA-binding winged helix-turn-helix (wHTH) protein